MQYTRDESENLQNKNRKIRCAKKQEKKIKQEL